MTVRTRFAPSPTGYLHIGGARTALFCWLYARRHGGEFVLRIEDTDRERSTEASVQAILDGMAWLGLEADEGPFYQTQRFDRYREVVQQLLDSGHAYHCYCSPDELQQMRDDAMARKEKPRYNGFWRDRTDPPPAGVDPVVRFRNPLDGEVVINDLVKGDITIANSELDDLVIMRSDGTPTYNLTVVVDDLDMNITHVIRGDDHVNNTPRQINMYRAIAGADAALPAFAHLPMILGEDGKHLSKRHGAVSVMQYEEDGYLPEGLLNYLVRLGWSAGDQEIFSREEMIELFSLEAVNRAGSVFNPEKLDWVNQQHIGSIDHDALASRLQVYLGRAGIDEAAIAQGAPLADVADLLRERAKTMIDMSSAASYFYRAPTEYDPKAEKKQLTAASVPVLQLARDKFAALDSWLAEDLQNTVQATVDELEVGFGKLGLPLRVALTGGTASPALDQTLELIGREAVLGRLDAAIAHIEGRADS